MVGLEVEVQGTLSTGSGALHDVEVGHGGGDVGVTHQVLDGADVGTGFKEMGCEAVTQRISTLLINSIRRGSLTGSIRFLAVKFR